MSDNLPTAAIIGVGARTATRGGASAIAYAHAYAMRDLGVPLVAAAARSQANRDGIAIDFPGIRTFADWRAMLREVRPQLVSICAWPRQREEMALAAIAAGVRIIWIEKPIALAMDAARRIVDAAERAGVRIFVHHQRRFGHPFRMLTAACAEGRLGRIQSATISQPWPNLMDFGCHLADTVLSCLPGRRPVRALAAAVPSASSYQEVPVEAEAAGTVWLDDGVRIDLASGPAVPGQPLIRIDGSHGFAELLLDPLPGEGGVLRARWKDGTAVESPLLLENFHHDYLDRGINVLRFLDEILRATAEGRPSCVDAREGLRALEVVLGFYESAARRSVVQLPLQQADCPLDRLSAAPALRASA